MKHLTIAERIERVLSDKSGKFPKQKEALRKYWRHEKAIDLAKLDVLLKACEAALLEKAETSQEGA